MDARQFIPGFKARPGLTNWSVFDEVKVNKNQGHGGNKSHGNKRRHEQSRNSEEPESKKPVTACGNTETVEIAASAPVPITTTTSTDINDLIRDCVTLGNMTHYPTPADVPDTLKRKIRVSLFPPTPAEAAWMGLEKCLRCVPHDEDSGGFFVTTLRKIKRDVEAVELNVEESVPAENIPAQVSGTADVPILEPIQVPTATAVAASSTAPSQTIYYKQVDDATYTKLQEFYGFADTNTDTSSTSTRNEVCNGSFFIREEFVKHNSNKSNKNPNSETNKADTLKTIYYIPPVLKEVLHGDCVMTNTNNSGLEFNNANGKLKVVTVGKLIVNACVYICLY